LEPNGIRPVQRMRPTLGWQLRRRELKVLILAFENYSLSFSTYDLRYAAAKKIGATIDHLFVI
jgi:hypothetical protein